MKLLWITLLPHICFGFATYGTKRYGRSDGHSNPSWVPLPVYRQQPGFTHAPPYYGPIVYPYAQEYSDDYYYPPKPVLHYPSIAVVRPIHKLEMYQGYPHYYSAERGRPVYSPYSDYDASEPMDNIHDEILQEEAREEREEALPVGQETWYERETSTPQWGSPNYDDVNAAFLQNLILSEMYKDSVERGELNQKKEASFEEPEKDEETDIYGDRNIRDFEDIDVRELKALAGKPLYHVPKTNKMFPAHFESGDYGTVKTKVGSAPPHSSDNLDSDYKQFYDDQKYFNEDYPNEEAWINWGSKRSADQKPLKTKTIKKVKSNVSKVTKSYPRSTTTVSPPTSTTVKTAIRLTKDGQKEVVLLRPATPLRHPFPDPIIRMIATEPPQVKRSPTVYETIKHLLTMEADAQKGDGGDSRLRKRFVSTEGDLVGELRGLKSRNRA